MAPGNETFWHLDYELQTLHLRWQPALSRGRKFWRALRLMPARYGSQHRRISRLTADRFQKEKKDQGWQ